MKRYAITQADEIESWHEDDFEHLPPVMLGQGSYRREVWPEPINWTDVCVVAACVVAGFVILGVAIWGGIR